MQSHTGGMGYPLIRGNTCMWTFGHIWGIPPSKFSVFLNIFLYLCVPHVFQRYQQALSVHPPMNPASCLVGKLSIFLSLSPDYSIPCLSWNPTSMESLVSGACFFSWPVTTLSPVHLVIPPAWCFLVSWVFPFGIPIPSPSTYLWTQSLLLLESWAFFFPFPLTTLSPVYLEIPPPWSLW